MNHVSQLPLSLKAFQYQWNQLSEKNREKLHVLMNDGYDHVIPPVARDRNPKTAILARYDDNDFKDDYDFVVFENQNVKPEDDIPSMIRFADTDKNLSQNVKEAALAVRNAIHQDILEALHHLPDADKWAFINTERGKVAENDDLRRIIIYTIADVETDYQNPSSWDDLGMRLIDRDIALKGIKPMMNHRWMAEHTIIADKFRDELFLKNQESLQVSLGNVVFMRDAFGSVDRCQVAYSDDKNMILEDMYGRMRHLQKSEKMDLNHAIIGVENRVALRFKCHEGEVDPVRMVDHANGRNRDNMAAYQVTSADQEVAIFLHPDFAKAYAFALRNRTQEENQKSVLSFDRYLSDPYHMDAPNQKDGIADMVNRENLHTRDVQNKKEAVFFSDDLENDTKQTKASSATVVRPE